MSVDLGLLAEIFPNMEELKLSNLDIAFDPDHPPLPIIFVHLKRLFVEGNVHSSADMLGDWLEYISCPILTDLTIDQNITTQLTSSHAIPH